MHHLLKIQRFVLPKCVNVHTKAYLLQLNGLCRTNYSTLSYVLINFWCVCNISTKLDSSNGHCSLCYWFSIFSNSSNFLILSNCNTVYSDYSSFYLFNSKPRNIHVTILTPTATHTFAFSYCHFVYITTNFYVQWRIFTYVIITA